MTKAINNLQIKTIISRVGRILGGAPDCIQMLDLAKPGQDKLPLAWISLLQHLGVKALSRFKVPLAPPTFANLKQGEWSQQGIRKQIDKNKKLFPTLFLTPRSQVA